MGLGGVSVSELAIILVIVVLVFGTKHLKTLGGDLGGAIRGFRRAMEGKDPPEPSSAPPSVQGKAASAVAAPEAPPPRAESSSPADR